MLIYALIDPRSGDVRYVGKTANARQRLWAHTSMSGLRAKPTPRASWLLSLLKRELRPIFVVLEECGEDRADDCERKWIKHHRFWSESELTNVTDGGEGGATIRGRKNPRSAECRAKISASKKGTVPNMTPEQRRARGQKIAEARRRNGTTNAGRTWTYSPETLAMYRDAARWRVRTPEGRAQILRATKARQLKENQNKS